jgi:hypothetical protein
MDHEYMLPNGSFGLEVEHRDPDEPELGQDVLDEFLADCEAFVTQTNWAIESLEDLYASLCYVGNTAPELMREAAIPAFPVSSGSAAISPVRNLKRGWPFGSETCAPR